MRAFSITPALFTYEVKKERQRERERDKAFLWCAHASFITFPKRTVALVDASC